MSVTDEFSLVTDVVNARYQYIDMVTGTMSSLQDIWRRFFILDIVPLLYARARAVDVAPW
jgi:hypothetical protein